MKNIGIMITTRGIVMGQDIVVPDKVLKHDDLG
jgi:hypothetical protein